MYWLGSFPVAPLNMILASFYSPTASGWTPSPGFTPISTFIAWWTLAIAIVGMVLFFVPAYLGIRIGAGFATVLGVIAIVPLTFLAVAFLFTGDADSASSRASAARRHQLLLELDGTGWFTLYCRLHVPAHLESSRSRPPPATSSETRDPARDAKIAMNLEDGYGLFIYT